MGGREERGGERRGERKGEYNEMNHKYQSQYYL